MRILFISSTRIGDAILASGALAYLHDRYPRARFTIACGPAAVPLFAKVPNLERIIPLRRSGRHGHWFRLWAACVGRYWSVIVDLRRSLVPYLVLSGRRYRMAAGAPELHKVEQVARMMRSARPLPPKIWIGPEHVANAAALIPDGAPVLALAPTANWGGKQWPGERFAALIERLCGARGILAGARIAVFSAPAERASAVRVLAAVPESRRLDLAGKTDLLTASAALARCTMFVGNDSALMHLAAAAGIPTLGLFGPSKEEHYAPWGPLAAAVRTERSYEEIVNAAGYDYRSHESHMGSLSVDKVAAAAEKLWSSQCAGRASPMRARG